MHDEGRLLKAKSSLRVGQGLPLSECSAFLECHSCRPPSYIQLGIDSIVTSVRGPGSFSNVAESLLRVWNPNGQELAGG